MPEDRQVEAPHVLMFLTGALPFGHDWARAASRVAKVTTVDRYISDEHRASIPARSEGRMVYIGHLARARPRRLFSPTATAIQSAVLLRALHRIEAERGPVDVIHSHFWSGAGAISLMARMAGIPHIHTEHSSAFCREQREPGRTLSPPGARDAKALFRRASRVLFVSSYLEREVRRAVGFGDGLVVPNPVDTDTFAVREMPPHHDEVRLIHVGRLSPEKGLLALVEAFAVAARADARLRLTLVGGGPDEAALRQRVSALGVNDEVTFTGPRPKDDIPALLGASHIYVSNGAVETFGVAVAEAVSVGRVVVAPSHCALPEVVGDTGVLFQPGRPDALVEAIQTAVAQLPTWNVEHCRAFAVERYGLESVAARLGRVYADVAKSKRRWSRDAGPSAH
jgi:glycosyltransferase involved in cell wall biosynthesis